jgi:hypothetical protein
MFTLVLAVRAIWMDGLVVALLVLVVILAVVIVANAVMDRVIAMLISLVFIQQSALMGTEILIVQINHHQ